MPRQSRYNWPQLIADFEQSDLSQVAFCKQQNLNVKYFNLKLSKHRAQDAGAFTKVEIQPHAVSLHGLVLEVGKCKIYCPDSMPIPSFISLVQLLA